MIRTLTLIAVAGFLVSVVTLSTAIGIAGPEAIAHGAWSWGPGGHWNVGRDHGGWGVHADDDRPAGPQATRELSWTGGDTLSVDVPAEITYTQSPGPAKLTVSGPQRALDNLVLEGGRLTFKDGSDHGRHHRRRSMDSLTIVMTAPSVSRFELNGSNRLTIAGYKQEALKLEVSGDAEVKVAGEAKRLDLQITGSGETDLSDLKLQDAEVGISGSGEAIVAPTVSARLDISGSGDITLLTHPGKLESNVSGSGAIHQADRAMPEKPAPSATAPKGPKPAQT